MPSFTLQTQEPKGVRSQHTVLHTVFLQLSCVCAHTHTVSGFALGVCSAVHRMLCRAIWLLVLVVVGCLVQVGRPTARAQPLRCHLGVGGAWTAPWRHMPHSYDAVTPALPMAEQADGRATAGHAGAASSGKTASVASSKPSNKALFQIGNKRVTSFDDLGKCFSR